MMSFLHQGTDRCLFPVTSVCHSERGKVNSNCTALKTVSSHSDLLEEPDLILLIKQRCSRDYLSCQLLAYRVQSALRSSFKEYLIKQDKAKSLESKIIFHIP